MLPSFKDGRVRDLLEFIVVLYDGEYVSCLLEYSQNILPFKRSLVLKPGEQTNFSFVLN